LYGWQWLTDDTAVATVSKFSAGNNLKSFCGLSCLRLGSDIGRSEEKPYLCGNGQVEPGEDCDVAASGEVTGVSCNYKCLRPGNEFTTTTVGIDIGTFQVKAVVAEQSNTNRGLPRIVGTGYAESKGLRHGYIINPGDVTKSIASAIHQAEKASNYHIRRVFLSVGGIGLSSTEAVGTVVISRADSEITELDLENVLADAEKNIPEANILNRKIIHTIPIRYLIDSKPVLGNPLGLRGMRLEVKVLFITSLENHLADLIEAVEDTGVEVVDVMASPIAASFVTLTKTQKIAGCVLANVGAETVSIVVFENDKVIEYGLPKRTFYPNHNRSYMNCQMLSQWILLGKEGLIYCWKR